MALLKLGEETAANARFQALFDYGTANYGQQVKMDFFAVSHPDLMIFDDDLSHRNQIHCLYLQALGTLGLGGQKKAAQLFKTLADLDPAHQGANLHAKMLSRTI
jgi:hypothetical protein